MCAPCYNKGKFVIISFIQRKLHTDPSQNTHTHTNKDRTPHKWYVYTICFWCVITMFNSQKNMATVAVAEVAVAIAPATTITTVAGTATATNGKQ